jgi:hypothetical protein
MFPFNLIPFPYNFVAGGVAILAVLGTLWGVKHHYDEHQRDIGRAEIQAQWDADKAARIKRTTELTLLLSGKLQAAMDDATQREGKAHAQFVPLETRAAGVAAGHGVALPADVAGVLDSASRAANSAHDRAAGEARTDPVPTVPETQVYDERELAEWGVKAAAAYNDAYGLWASCRAREDILRSALQGAPP